MNQPPARPPLRAPRRWLDYPLAVGGAGRIATTEVDDHVRDMIEQVLFTRPGERVMRPDFGCGLLDAVFEPNAPFIAAATELLVRGSLDRWLADEARIESVAVTSEDSRLVVEVTYTRLVDGDLRTERFPAPATGGAA